MIHRRQTTDTTRSEAVYSACENYRYSLTRQWQDTGPKLAFIMLNPSTADEMRNDPTVERCERRARAMGFAAFRVVNIFAWRATDPQDLRRAAEPVGPENHAAVLAAAGWADQLLAAWGVHGAHRAQGPRVEALLRDAGHPLCHLGLTRQGHPRHPLYVAYAVTPQPWPAATAH